MWRIETRVAPRFLSRRAHVDPAQGCSPGSSRPIATIASGFRLSSGSITDLRGRPRLRRLSGIADGRCTFIRPEHWRSVRTGALHALFLTAARRQSWPCRERPHACPDGASRSAMRRRWKSTSIGFRRTCPRSRLLVAGRAKARCIHRFAANISTRSGCCPWFE